MEQYELTVQIRFPFHAEAWREQKHTQKSTQKRTDNRKHAIKNTRSKTRDQKIT